MKTNLKKLLPGVRENISLKNYNTFKIGGKTRYFFAAKNKDKLVSAILVAKKLKLPFFILGNGSNLLVSDKGFKGLVVKIKSGMWKVEGSKTYAEAGVFLTQLLTLALKNNLTGLEWAIGIPGTLGGAIYGNAGAFGKSMSNIVKEVEVYDTNNRKIKILKNKDCKFGYRQSIFKNNKNLIIISAKLRLKKGNKEKIKQKMRAYSNHRVRTQPLKFPSIGSIFKNPKGLFAAELIEKCGLKGKRTGNVQVSEKHSNFIINLGKGKARDVLKLINLIKKRVKEKFEVNLEEEIIYLGF